MPNLVPLAAKLSKTLKQTPKGVDETAHTVASFEDLGNQVTDPLALAAHTARGRTSFASASGDFLNLTEDEFIAATSHLHKERIDVLTPQSADVNALLISKSGTSSLREHRSLNLESIIEEGVGRTKLKEFMQGSKLKLEKPLYVMRAEGIFSGQHSSAGKPDSIYSFKVVDPLRPDTFRGYNPSAEETPPIIYKLPPGTDVLHPAGRADAAEVVVSRENLDKATDAMIRPRYLESLAKGTAAFGAVGVAITAGSEDVQAEESAQAPKEASVAEQDDTQLHTNIQGLLDKGTDGKLIYDRLVAKEGQGRANQIMLGAMGPRVQKLRDQGVATADIMDSFRRKGINIGDVPESAPAISEQASKPTLRENLQSGALTKGIAGFGVEPEADPSLTLENGQTVSEMTASINNMELRYEDLYDSAAGATGFAPQLKAQAAEARDSTNQIIQNQVTKHLPDGKTFESIDEYGTVSIKDAKTGKVTEYDEDLLDGLLASSYEVADATMGAIAGAKFAGPHPIARIAGAVLGGAIGAGFGRGADVLRHSQTLNYKIDMNRLLSQMNDAGVADVTMSALGTTAFKVIGGTSRMASRGLHRAWDLFVAGNKQGAQKTLLDVFSLNDAQAIKLVNDWEKVTGQKVLSEEARLTGKLAPEDADPAMRVLSETLPGGQDLVTAAKGEADSGAARLSQQIDERAKDVTQAAKDITTENIDVVVREKLGAYRTAVGDHFQQVKDLGLESMKGSGYRFDFDVALVPAMQKAAKGITNPSLRKEFYNHLENIRDFTGTPLGSETKQAKLATKGAQADTAAARSNVTALKAERAPLVLQQRAAVKRGKTLKTKPAKAKAAQLAKDLGLQIKRLDKQIVGASEDVATKARTTAEAAKDAIPVITGAAGAPRSFENLLQLRASLNELSSNPSFKGHTNFEQMKAAKAGVDSEIEKAALEHMPNGKAWLSQWKKTNIEFSKMKNLESNTLYKAITSKDANMDRIIKSATDSLGSTSSETFMQVMGKLEPKTRALFEGAVVKNVIKKHTVGFEGGKQSINLPAISEQLDKLAFTQPEARALKRTVKQISEVFKNDVHLQAVAGSLPMPKFQAYLTDNPAVRVKFAVASKVFNAATSRIPFSTNAGRAALVKNLGTILDNPLDHKAVKDVQKTLPDDPELKTALHQLAVQFVEAGKPEAYGKVPIYRVHRPGEFGKVGDTQLGKGRLFYTDKATADSIAKQTGAKVKAEHQVHKTIATAEEVTNIVGHELTAKEMKDPEVLQLLKDRQYRGIAVGDKVMLFE